MLKNASKAFKSQIKDYIDFHNKTQKSIHFMLYNKANNSYTRYPLEKFGLHNLSPDIQILVVKKVEEFLRDDFNHESWLEVGGQRVHLN